MSETKQEFFDKLNAEQKAVSIPYYLHEGEMFRLERLNKRWFIAFLIVLVMLFVTNGAWIAHEMQYKDEMWTYEIQQDSGEGGTNNYTDNVVRFVGGENYAEADSENSGKTAGAENQQQQLNQTMP